LVRKHSYLVIFRDQELTYQGQKMGQKMSWLRRQRMI